MHLTGNQHFRQAGRPCAFCTSIFLRQSRNCRLVGVNLLYKPTSASVVRRMPTFCHWQGFQRKLLPPRLSGMDDSKTDQKLWIAGSCGPALLVLAAFAAGDTPSPCRFWCNCCAHSPGRPDDYLEAGAAGATRSFSWLTNCRRRGFPGRRGGCGSSVQRYGGQLQQHASTSDR